MVISPGFVHGSSTVAKGIMNPQQLYQTSRSGWGLLSGLQHWFWFFQWLDYALRGQSFDKPNHPAFAEGSQMVPNLFQRIPDEQAGISFTKSLMNSCRLWPPSGRNCPNCRGLAAWILGKSQDWRCFSSQSSNSQYLFFHVYKPNPWRTSNPETRSFLIAHMFVIVFFHPRCGLKPTKT